MSNRPTAVVEKLYQVMNDRDLDVLDQICHPKVTLNGQPSSPAEIKEFCGMYLSAFGDMTLTVERLVADGEWVAARVVARGTHTAPFGELPATGRKVEVSQHEFHRLVDGQITESWSVFDQYALLQQLGALPADS